MRQLHRDSFILRTVLLAVCATGLVMLLLLTACGLRTPSFTSATVVARVVWFDLVDDRDAQASIPEALRKDGWIEGQNLVIDIHMNPDATGTVEWLPAVEDDVVHGHPVVLITGSSAHAVALMHATRTVPVVVSIGDPVALRLASSVAHPGGNITGVSSNPFSQFGKRIEILKELLPHLRHLGVLYADPANPNLPAQIDAFDSAGRQLGMDMVPVQAGKHVEEFSVAFETLDRAHVDALYVVRTS